MGIEHINKGAETAAQETKVDSKVSEGTPESKVEPAKKMVVTEKLLMDRDVKVITDQSFGKLQLALIKKGTTPLASSVKEKLAKLDITSETTELPNDFAEILFASPDFTLSEKQIIMAHFQPSFDAHYSREAIEKDVTAYRASDAHRNASDKQIDLAIFQEKLVAKAFQHNVYALLIQVMAHNASDEMFLKLLSDNQSALLDKLSYTSLQTLKTGAEAELQILETLQGISDDPVFISHTAKIAATVAELYSEAVQLEEPVLQKMPEQQIDPEVQKAKEKELKKLFMDQDVLRSLAFLQSTQTETDAKILTFSRLKVNKSAMEKITESDEYKELMIELESIMFNDKIKEQLSDALAALTLDPNNSSRQKVFKKSMSKVRKQMVTNLKSTLTDIQNHADTGKKLNPKHEKLSNKLIAVIQKAGSEKIATRDTVNIILKRVAIGIGLAIAAAIVGTTIAYLLPLFLAAAVATIVGYCIIAAFAVFGFGIGVSGNQKIIEKFSQFLALFQGNTPNAPLAGALAEG